MPSIEKSHMLDISVHRSRFFDSEIARTDINTKDVKRAVVVQYLASQDSIVIDLLEEDNPVYERLAKISLANVEVTIGK